MNRNVPDGRRGGFSLVEVALAMMVAASGLLAAFSLFPVSLRQSVDSRDTLIEAAFASSLLETIGANVRQIADAKDWNDVDAWWEAAVGDGVDDPPEPKSYAKPGELRRGFENVAPRTKGFSLSTCQVAESWKDDQSGDREVRYYGRERTEVPGVGKEGRKTIQEPAQWLLRLSVVRRRARSGGNALGAWLPNRYVVTVVSSPDPSPERYIQNPSFTQEYFFANRP